MSPRSPQGRDHSATSGLAVRAGMDQWLRRQRLERQLHDGAALRISALSLRLGLLRHLDPADEAVLRRSVDELQDELHAVLQELRDVAAKIYPPLLDQAGLGPALRELVDQAGAEVSVVAPRGERFGPVAEGAAYFAVAECLTAMTAEPTRPVRVALQREDDELVLSLTGVPACHAEFVGAHARPLGGTVDVTDVVADPSGGSTITVRIPCE